MPITYKYRYHTYNKETHMTDKTSAAPVMSLDELVAIEGYADEYGTVTDEMLTKLFDVANAHLNAAPVIHIERSTLEWWLQLVTLNPNDLIPRIQSRLDAPTPDVVGGDVERALQWLHVLVTSSHNHDWKRNREEWAVIRRALAAYKNLASAAPRQAVPGGWVETIRAVVDALDKATGDSDPNMDDDLTDDEVREEFPEVWAMQQLSAMLAAAPSAGRMGVDQC